MPLTSPNLQIAIDSSNTTGWTFNGSNVSNIPSLESAAGFLDQGAVDKQPLYENGLIKNTLGNPQFMWTPNPGSDDSIWWPDTGEFIVSIRFRIDTFPSSTYNNRKILSARDDNFGCVFIALEKTTTGDNHRIIVDYDNIEVDRMDVVSGQWYTITYQYQYDGGSNTSVAKAIIDTNPIVSNTSDSVSGSSFSRVFGDPNQTDFEASYSHFYLSHEYLTDTGMQEVHDFVSNEFNGPSPSITISGIKKADGVTNVPDGTAVQHLYADDNKGTNETSLEVKTTTGGEVTFDQELPTGKVRFIRTIYRENGRDHAIERFFSD